MWQYYAFKFAGYSLSFLPKRIGYLLARLIADVVFSVASRVSVNIAVNLHHVLGPEVNDRALRRSARGVLCNIACNYFDLIKLPRLKRRDLERSLCINGWEHLETALAKGRGVVLVTAHMGSFDTAVQIFALRSVKTTVLVEPIKPPALLAHVTRLRQSHGITFLPSQPGTLGALFRCLRRGEAVLFASDRDIDNNGLRTTFFGKETTMPTIAVRIAMKTGAALVPCFNRRRMNGKYDLNIEPAIEIVGRESGTSVADTVEKVVRVMEKHIRRTPEQWVV
ncbi:MAG: lysophospholipid acyltransferase family protein, partial [Anaerolineales bacterium]|nr:lysophospholipid acyltransferase family protein [Anaerolineales bacterium]